jgi:2-octaprenyl-6-methoxyphenol hydroxylase
MKEASVFDIAIVGGGPISMSLALSLAELPIRVAIIEAADVTQRVRHKHDWRSLALSQSSQRILTSLQVWPDLESQAVALTGIHVSKQGGLFATRMDAKRYGFAAFGYVLELHPLLVALQQTLMQHESMTWFSPALVTDVTQQQEHVTLTIKQQDEVKQLQARLVIAADGVHSKVRQAVGISAIEYDYQHSAIVANVTLARPHQHIAYERFCGSGPMAMLPNGRQQAALVWSLTHERAQQLQQLTEEVFLQKLQKTFGYRLGKLTQVSTRHTYPLKLMLAKKNHQGRVLLLGNAAHTLHPIAGQGFNLGLRDVAALSELIREFQAHDGLAQTDKLLERYDRWRTGDHATIVAFTDGLVKFFDDKRLMMTALQNASLLAADISPFFKNRLQRLAMGLAGFVPDLVSGYRKWES